MEKEWKIGEIKQVNGEWYQCIKSDSYRCDYCDYGELGNCDDIACRTDERKDGKEVYFKKLEKTGEPYEYFVQHKGTVMLQPYKLFTTPIINGVVCNLNYDTNTIDLEIKQNKEDMEEYKMHDAKEDIPEFDKVVDECLFGENKLNLKPFNLQKAKEGKSVCTRDGRKVRIICFDREFIYEGQNYCILALINDGSHGESVYSYTEDGLFSPNKIHNSDLMILPEKKEGWVNVYRDCDGVNITKDDNIYSSKDAAISSAQVIDRENYVATTIIKWEE